MLDLSDENFLNGQIDIIVNKIKNSRQGMKFDDIWNLLQDIEEISDVSRIIREAINQNKIARIGTKYFYRNPNGNSNYTNITEDLVEVNAAEVEEKKAVQQLKEEAKKQPRVFRTRVNKNSVTRTVMLNDNPDIPIATRFCFSKDTLVGQVALMFYLLKDHYPLTTEDILKVFPSISFYYILNRLTKSEIIKRVDVGKRKHLYQWSGQYSYPFERWSEFDKNNIPSNYVQLFEREDPSLIIEKNEKLDVSKISKKAVDLLVGGLFRSLANNQVIQGNKDALILSIENEIKLLEQQIQNLSQLKDQITQNNKTPTATEN